MAKEFEGLNLSKYIGEVVSYAVNSNSVIQANIYEVSTLFVMHNYLIILITTTLNLLHTLYWHIFVLSSVIDTLTTANNKVPVIVSKCVLQNFLKMKCFLGTTRILVKLKAQHLCYHLAGYINITMFLCML